MCGIYGFIEKNEAKLTLDHVIKMGEVINYRGPDDGDYYFKNGLLLEIKGFQ